MSKIVVLIGLKSYTHDDIISIYNEYSTTMIEIAQQHTYTNQVSLEGAARVFHSKNAKKHSFQKK